MRKLFLVSIIVILTAIMAYVFLPYKLVIHYDEVVYQGDAPNIDDAEAVAINRAGMQVPGYIELYMEEKEGRYLIHGVSKSGFGTLENTTEIPILPVRTIQASYNGTLHEGDVPDPALFQVQAIYADGTKKEIGYQIAELDAINGPTDIRINTEFGEASVRVQPQGIESLEAEYLTVPHVGDPYNPDDMQVWRIAHDGHKTKLASFETDAPDIFSADIDITVMYGAFRTSVRVHVIPVTSVSPCGFHTQAGSRPGIDQVEIVYSDGTKRTVPRQELDFEESLSDGLQEGTNTYHFTWAGNRYSFAIHAGSKSLVEEAKEHFAEEFKLADYRYASDTIFVTVTRHKAGDAYYFLSHVVINNPSQLRSGLSYGDYGGQRELPTDAAKRLNWVIGTNGSNFNYATGTPEYAGVCIKDGQVMEGSSTNGLEICLMSNGVLFSPNMFVDPQQLIASGVTDSWSCGDTLLLQDGEAVNVNVANEEYRYPRTAVGMVQPCEYYLITAGDGNYEGGMTYAEVRAVLMSHGCCFGKCMDGGGSSSLVFRGQLLNTPAANAERAVVDFLYFVE